MNDTETKSTPMPKINSGLDGNSISYEADIQYAKMLNKLETILEKIKERRTKK